MSSSTPVLPPDPERAGPPDQLNPTDRRLATIEAEVRRQGSSIRSTETKFTLLAVVGLILSFLMLGVVAAKLDKPTKVVTTAAPASAAAPPAAAKTAAPPSTSAETLTEKTISGTSPLAAGPVTFKVKNAGSVTHEFVVLKTNTPAGQLPTDKAGKASEKGNIGETGDMKPGAAKTLKLNLAAGHYALICNLPGHYKAGMYADLTVK
jgi:uncharacterized cupredoxin-like copper-binding protein